MSLHDMDLVLLVRPDDKWDGWDVPIITTLTSFKGQSRDQEYISFADG